MIELCFTMKYPFSSADHWLRAVPWIFYNSLDKEVDWKIEKINVVQKFDFFSVYEVEKVLI